MLWRIKKSNLDEMQEQKLLYIEKNCFWFLYLMLAAVILIQLVMGRDKRDITGEMLCFMTVSLVMVASCIRKGVWDRHLKADAKTNLKVSLLAAAVAGVISTAVWYKSTHYQYGAAQLLSVLFIYAFLTFAVTFVLLCICTGLYSKRVRKLEKEEEEEETGND